MFQRVSQPWMTARENSWISFFDRVESVSYTHLCDGLRINRKCQVYDTNHQIIEGLYSIGDCSGSFFAGNYPEYFVGVAVGRTMTQGRVAVKTILGEEL